MTAVGHTGAPLDQLVVVDVALCRGQGAGRRWADRLGRQISQVGGPGLLVSNHRRHSSPQPPEPAPSPSSACSYFSSRALLPRSSALTLPSSQITPQEGAMHCGQMAGSGRTEVTQPPGGPGWAKMDCSVGPRQAGYHAGSAPCATAPSTLALSRRLSPSLMLIRRCSRQQSLQKGWLQSMAVTSLGRTSLMQTMQVTCGSPTGGGVGPWAKQDTRTMRIWTRKKPGHLHAV